MSGGGGEERWLLTYADMITLLLALFVILYGMAKQDTTQFARFSGAIRQAFIHRDLADTPSSKYTVLSNLQLYKLLKENLGQGEEGKSQSQTSMVASPIVSVVQTSEGVAIRLQGGDLTFEPASATLTPIARQILGKVSATLRTASGNSCIRVEGYTDDIAPGTAQFPTNWELSSARAVAVVRYLIEMGRVGPPSRFSAAAYSEYHPIASNTSRLGREANRHVDIVVLNSSTSCQTSPIPVLPTPDGV